MNYYLAKVNPEYFRLLDYLNTSPKESLWTVCKAARPGDVLFIGLAGKEAGIYAEAIINSTPTCISDAPDFWINLEKATKPEWRAKVNFSHNLVHSHIPEENLKTTSELRRVVKWLHVQGTACHLTAEEVEAISRLIKHFTGRK